MHGVVVLRYVPVRPAYGHIYPHPYGPPPGYPPPQYPPPNHYHHHHHHVHSAYVPPARCSEETCTSLCQD
eukprot:2913393-Amphidinium_carterae.1